MQLTNLDKVLFPAKRAAWPALTKRDLIRHHATIGAGHAPVPRRPAGQPAPLSRRHRQARLLAQGRAVARPGLAQRWRYEDADPGETEWYFVARLARRARLGRQLRRHRAAPVDVDDADDPHQPTWAMIDIDPGESSSFDDVAGARAACTARPSTTSACRRARRSPASVASRSGCRSPTGYTFDDTRAWVERLSRAIGDTVPDLVSWEWEIAKRGGRTRLDYTQNAINKTLVAPFSTRPVAGAPVSVPIGWDELDDPDLRPDRWTIRDVGDRLAPSRRPARAADRSAATASQPLSAHTSTCRMLSSVRSFRLCS